MIVSKIDKFLGEGYRGDNRPNSNKKDYDLFYIDGMAESIHNKFDLIKKLKDRKIINVQDSVKTILDYIKKGITPHCAVDPCDTVNRTLIIRNSKNLLDITIQTRRKQCM